MTGVSEVWAGPFDLPPLGDISDLPTRQAEWRSAFARHLYGPRPEAPEALTVERHPLATANAERLVITVSQPRGSFTVDAALWLPLDRASPVPLICGLDFVGPAGILMSDDFPLDPAARVYSRPEFGAPDGRLTDVLRGTSAYRWPIEMMLARGYAVLASCYGSWTPDDPALWKAHGVAAGCGETDNGAISCWAWAISRLLDVAAELPEIDGSRVAVAGHSRLGKAALWAMACDDRIGAVLANNSGCGGAAPARHPVGETLAEMAMTFPHWLRPGFDTGLPPLDQHHLIACAAPRAVYIASAEDDVWADPLGSYQALRTAAEAWSSPSSAWDEPQVVWNQRRDLVTGRLGHHIRPGGHDLLPYDWKRFLDFLETPAVVL